MQAFHGSEAAKRECLATLDRDIANGAVLDGPTAWRDGRGSIAGSLLRSDRLDEGEATLGMPATVLALLDHFGGHIYFAHVPTLSLARGFVTNVTPGADLGDVPAALVERLIGDPAYGLLGESSAWNDVADALRRRDRAPSSGAIEAVVAEGVSPETADLLRLLAVPLDRTSRILAVIEQFLHARSREAVRRSGWSDAQEAAAQAELQRLWMMTEDRRRAGDWPDYPALFRASAPALAEGYEHALARLNDCHGDTAGRIVALFLAIVAATPAAGSRA